MLSEYNKLQLEDEAGKNNLVIEVNYKDTPEVNECKMLRLTYPDGKQAYIKREHFMTFLFAIGKAEEQRKMIPKKLTTIRKYQTMLGITATKDIKKGEKINVTVDIPLPPIEQEIIGEAKRQLSRDSSEIWIPKTQ